MFYVPSPTFVFCPPPRGQCGRPAVLWAQEVYSQQRCCGHRTSAHTHTIKKNETVELYIFGGIKEDDKIPSVSPHQYLNSILRFATKKLLHPPLPSNNLDIIWNFWECRRCHGYICTHIFDQSKNLCCDSFKWYCTYHLLLFEGFPVQCHVSVPCNKRRIVMFWSILLRVTTKLCVGNP